MKFINTRKVLVFLSGIAAVILIILVGINIQGRSMQTGEYQIKETFIVLATMAASTRTPGDTPVIPPTGTREDMYIKPSGEKLGLAALNGWFGIVDGYKVTIYAGAVLEDAQQGAIVILIALPYRNFDEKILTPTRHGAVRIIGEQNNRLTLLAVDGEIFYFDVPARRYVTSFTESVSSAIPPPTYTPYTPPRGTQVSTFDPYAKPVSFLPKNRATN